MPVIASAATMVPIESATVRDIQRTVTRSRTLAIDASPSSFRVRRSSTLANRRFLAGRDDLRGGRRPDRGEGLELGGRGGVEVDQAIARVGGRRRSAACTAPVRRRFSTRGNANTVAVLESRGQVQVARRDRRVDARREPSGCFDRVADARTIVQPVDAGPAHRATDVHDQHPGGRGRRQRGSQRPARGRARPRGRQPPPRPRHRPRQAASRRRPVQGPRSPDRARRTTGGLIRRSAASSPTGSALSTAAGRRRANRSGVHPSRNLPWEAAGLG